MDELARLWESVQPLDGTIDSSTLGGLPEPAARYLTHAIAPGAHRAEAVRLDMHGEVKLGTWRPFSARQVISASKGFIWRAKATMGLISISGSDRLIDGRGAMHWALFGLFPIIDASGPDITRAAIARVAVEAIWLPSAFCSSDVAWTAAGPARAHASRDVRGERIEIDLDVAADGALEAAYVDRWGNPGGGAFRYERFGGIVERERTFGGYTIPTRHRIGWYPGTPRFETEGEFLRISIDDAEYR